MSDKQCKKRLDDWFEANLAPESRTTFLDHKLPGLPSAAVQKRFTGRDGRRNLVQAFEFWKLMFNNLQPGDDVKVLDFGCGWGRIGRFWLLDLKPEQVYFADCLSDAIELFQSLYNPCRIEHCGTKPPLKERGPFDVISAYSVFSHLNEEYFNQWVTEYFKVLKQGGRLYITSRAESFIGIVEKWQRGGKKETFNGHMLPPYTELRTLYEQGEFQFYTNIGGGGELESSFYGQAFVPELYVRKAAERIGYTAVERLASPAENEQAIFMLTK